MKSWMLLVAGAGVAGSLALLANLRTYDPPADAVRVVSEPPADAVLELSEPPILVDPLIDDAPALSGRATREGSTRAGKVEHRLNEFLSSEQAHASLAVDGEGRVLVVWDSRRQRDGRYGVFGRIVDVDGSLASEEISWIDDALAATGAAPASGLQPHEPSAGWCGTSPVVAWSGRKRGGVAQISLRPGSDPLELPGEQGSDPVVVALADGSAFVIWTAAEGRNREIRGARLARGPADERLEPYSVLVRGEGAARNPAAAASGSGFVLVYDRVRPDGEIEGIRAQRFDGRGIASGAEVGVSEGHGDAIEPAVAALLDGGFVVGWMELHEETDYDPMLRAFARDGSPRTEPICAAADPSGWQSGIAVDAGPNGTLAAAWTEYGEAEDADVEFRLFTSALEPKAGESRLTRHGDGRQTLSGAHGARRIAWLPDGRLAAVWNGDGGHGDATGVHLTVLAPSALELSADDPASAAARVQHVDAAGSGAARTQRVDAPGTGSAATARSHESVVANSRTGDGQRSPSSPHEAAPVAPPVYDPRDVRTDLDPEPRTQQGDDVGFIGVTDTGWYPPDPHMAVGPEHVVLCTNGAVVAKTKSGVTVLEDELEGADGFFGSVGATFFVFDPEAMYDVYEDRYLVMANERQGNSRGYILLAVSSTSDPAGPWHKYRFDVTSAAGAWDIDSPNLAYDATGIYVTADFFTPSDKYLVFIIEKDSVLDGGPAATHSYLRTGTQSFGIPEMYTADAPRMYMIEHFDGGPRTQVRLWAIDDPYGTPSIQSVTLPVPAYYQPGYLRSRGTSVQIYLFESRFWSCMYRDGSLWACHHTAESTPTVSKARWYEFEMNGWPTSGSLPSLRQSGTVDPGAGIYLTFNSIAADAAGNAYMVFARSSVDEYFSIGRTYRLAGDPLGTMSKPATIKASNSSYSVDRWGDYSQVNADPAAPGTFWSHHEYTPGGNTWYTWVASETVEDPASIPEVAAPPLADLRVSPNPTRGAARIELGELAATGDVAASGDVVVSLHDAAGRMLRAWTASPSARIEIDWDGMDEKGRAVSSGLYMARATRLGEEIARGRIVVLP